ncbi:hypothetical protein JCM10207_006036 [Rhodosporidiobolus poonsookiae]
MSASAVEKSAAYSLNSLPNELIIHILALALPPPLPPPSEPLRLNDAARIKTRCKQLRTLGATSRRFLNIVDGFGELYTRWTPASFGALRSRGHAPPRHLTLSLDASWTPTLPLPPPPSSAHRIKCLRVQSLNTFLMLQARAPLPNLASLQFSTSVADDSLFIPCRDLPALQHLNILEPQSNSTRPNLGSGRLQQLLDNALGEACTRLTSLSFAIATSSAEESGPPKRTLATLLFNTASLRRLEISGDLVVDSTLALIPRLDSLRSLRLTRSASTPAAEHDPSFWSWQALAENAIALVQSPDRTSSVLVVVVKVEGTLSKYDVAQRSSRATFKVAASGVEVAQLRVELEYQDGRPPFRVWPLSVNRP